MSSLLARAVTRVTRCSAVKRVAAVSAAPFTSSSLSSFTVPSVSYAAIRCFGSISKPVAVTQKTTTNIAGLDVVPNGREVLIGLLREILASISAYNKALGHEPAYNDFVRRFTQHRLTIAEQEDDVSQIEKRIWSGQIEQLIEQAENELDLLVMMNEEVKPWEKPNAEEQAEFDRLKSASFGEDEVSFQSGVPKPLSKEEQALADAFWKDIDEEIKADQAREAEERRRR